MRWWNLFRDVSVSFLPAFLPVLCITYYMQHALLFMRFDAHLFYQYLKIRFREDMHAMHMHDPTATYGSLLRLAKQYINHTLSTCMRIVSSTQLAFIVINTMYM